GCAQFLRPTARVGAGIARSYDDASKPRCNHRIGARWRLACVIARLERDVQRRAPCGASSARERIDLGVRFAVPLVPPLTDYFAVAHHDCADQRIGCSLSPATLRERQRATHELLV